MMLGWSTLQAFLHLIQSDCAARIVVLQQRVKPDPLICRGMPNSIRRALSLAPVHIQLHRAYIILHQRYDTCPQTLQLLIDKLQVHLKTLKKIHASKTNLSFFL